MTELNIDKTDWKKVKFGDIVREPRESTKDLIADGFEHIVGLEHIDSGDIHLRKSETEDLETSFTKIFRKGDVLFGRRRAYLKKAALAEFDGVCSGDITLFRVKRDLIPELLPFVVHNENFFDFAIKHSAGGLSPRVKFKDLAKYEFLLPPLDQQKQLAQLLWAMDEVIEKEKMVREKLEIQDLSLLKKNFYDNKDEIIKLKKITKITKGKKPKKLLETGNGLPYCNTTYLRENVIENIVPQDGIGKAVRIFDGDLIILWDGSNAGEILFGKEGFLSSTMCKIEVTDERFIQDYIYHFLRFKTKDIKRATVGSAIPHVDSGMIENIELPILEIEEQKEIIRILKNNKIVIDNIDSKIHSSQQLLRSLIHQIF